MQTKLDSKKDYVFIDDVLDILPKISLQGKNIIYNVGSGKNISNEEIGKKLQEITGCEIEVEKNAIKYTFPTISINRIKEEFSFEPTSILENFEKIVSEYKK